MSVFSINCKKYVLNGSERSFGEEKIVRTLDNKELYATFFIECGNKEDNNSFTFEHYGDDDFVIEQNRCELNVYIKENKTPYDKNFTIICTHANDSEAYIEIEIIQKADEYKLEITNGAQNVDENKYTKQLKSIIQQKFNGTSADANYNYYEKCEFDISVKGGSKKYRIESILKCHEDPDNENQIKYSSFDKGFVYSKSIDKLVLTNYGRPFLDENDYYIIRLSHEDYRDLKIEIKITYEHQSRLSGRRSASLLRTRNRKNVPSRQVSEIYMPYSEFMHRMEKEKQIEQDMNKIETKIIFNEEIGDEYVINGQGNIVLPFKVYENDEISNLMVGTYSSGDWCSVKTDNTNRNLVLKIKNKPTIVRKCFVTINVIDYPHTYVKFILTNKP